MMMVHQYFHHCFRYLSHHYLADSTEKIVVHTEPETIESGQGSPSQHRNSDSSHKAGSYTTNSTDNRIQAQSIGSNPMTEPTQNQQSYYAHTLGLGRLGHDVAPD